MNKPPDKNTIPPQPISSAVETFLSGGDPGGVPFEWLVKAGIIDGRPYR